MVAITPGGESMNNDQLASAIDLMERALATMDAGGHGATASACRLQLAIDMAKVEVLKPPKVYFPERLSQSELRLNA